MRLKSDRARGVQLHHMLYESRRRPSSCGGSLNEAPGSVGTCTEMSISEPSYPRAVMCSFRKCGCLVELGGRGPSRERPAWGAVPGAQLPPRLTGNSPR